MKKALSILAASAAIVALLVGTAATATATPGKTSSCTGCHRRNTAVKVTVTRASATSTTVTYRVSISGGSGRTAWAVLSGGKNLARRSSSTGTFKIAKGKSFRVWGVKSGSGSNYRALVAK